MMDAIDESLLAELRAALVPGADTAARRAGADACRTLLAALDPPVTAAGPVDASPAAASAAALAVTTPAPPHPPPSQVLDMVIAHLRTKLPADQATRPASGAFRVAMIPMRRPRGP
jgi:hypothetical protein